MKVTAGEKDRQMAECYKKWPNRPRFHDPVIKDAYFSGYMAGEKMEIENAQTEERIKNENNQMAAE